MTAEVLSYSKTHRMSYSISYHVQHPASANEIIHFLAHSLRRKYLVQCQIAPLLRFQYLI